VQISRISVIRGPSAGAEGILLNGIDPGCDGFDGFTLILVHSSSVKRELMGQFVRTLKRHPRRTLSPARAKSRDLSRWAANIFLNVSQGGPGLGYPGR